MATEKRQRRRQGKVHRAPYRTRLEELLRTGQYSLDEMTAIIRAEFPEEEVSRSGVYRYEASIREFTEQMRELETSAQIIAKQYGKDAGDDTSGMLANAMVMLATDTVLKLNQKSASGQPVDVATVRAASQITKNAQESKRVSLQVRKQIEAEAREALLREQAERMDKIVKTGGLSADKAAELRKKILGIG